jgi:predicted permease
MSWLPWRQRDLDRDLREEMQFHVDMRAAQYRDRGLSTQDSKAAAHKLFGSTAILHEDARRMHIGAAASALEATARELGFAVRSLRRAPAFTVTAVLALTLGLGGASAVFSVVDHILFRGLPYSEGKRLASIGVRAPIFDHPVLLGGDYSEWKDERSALDGLTAVTDAYDCDLADHNPIRITCAGVASTFLPLFGVQTISGRNFQPEEDRPGAPGTVILSYSLWKERYAGDPSVAGRKISVNGQSATIVGVLPVSFEFPTLAQVDLLLPLRMDEATERKRQAVSAVNAYGRFKPGVSIAQAKTALEPFFQHFQNTITPSFRKEVRLEVTPLAEVMRRHARTAAWLLFGAVGAVLLIAWTNVANLWLARAARRAHEAAIRAALGAGRARLAIHHAAELSLVCVTGWVFGLATAAALLWVLRTSAPAGVIGIRHAALDTRIFLFSGAALTLTILTIALLPAGRISATRRMRLRSALITTQIAFSVFLVAAAGLLTHSLQQLSAVRFGVQTEGTVTASAVLGSPEYRTVADRYAFVQRLETALRGLPGVSGAAVADELPPLTAGAGVMFDSISVDGRPPAAGGPGGNVSLRHVTPDYFRALGIPLLRGRSLQNGENAVVVSDRLARRLFGAADPIGHLIQPLGWPNASTVVGVAADVRNTGLTADDAPEFYYPYDNTRGAPRFVSAVIRSTAQPPGLARLLTAEFHALDPTLPVVASPYGARIARLNMQPRFHAAVLSLFAGIGILLAALGVYGVLAFLVSQRSREIGVRMALGATRGRIVAWIVSYVMSWAGMGFVLGAAGAFLAARQFGSMLYGVQPGDPWTFGVVIALLAVVSLLAAWAPARRAATLDPAATLRHE